MSKVHHDNQGTVTYSMAGLSVAQVTRITPEIFELSIGGSHFLAADFFQHK